VIEVDTTRFYNELESERNAWIAYNHVDLACFNIKKIFNFVW